MRRLLSLTIGLLGVGCHALTPTALPTDTLQTEKHGAGQGANDHAHEGAAPAARSQSSPQASDLNLVNRAVACLERGEDAAACEFLARHVAAHPDHLGLRAQLADLLFRLKRLREAREEFARFTAAAQDRLDGMLPLMIHGHGRLLAIAESLEDDYEAHLQRGIGLYWLAQSRAALGDADGDLPVEGLLFKAAGELDQAHHLQPTQARPCWYLYSIWRGLAQQQPAQRWLDNARERAPTSFLTSTEQRQLHLAYQDVEFPRPR